MMTETRGVADARAVAREARSAASAAIASGYATQISSSAPMETRSNSVTVHRLPYVRRRTSASGEDRAGVLQAVRPCIPGERLRQAICDEVARRIAELVLSGADVGE